jgi:RND family efflux transporter MFP subunit
VSRRILAIGLALLAGLSVGCSKSGSSARAASERGARGEAKEVRVVRAVERALPQVVTVSGTLAAEEQVVLGMKVSGRISELLVDLGSRVTKGQPVARLDPLDFQLRLQQAEAAFAQARARLGLSPSGADDRVNIDETSVVRQARAVLDEARARRDRARELFREKLTPQSELDTVEANYLVAESRFQDALEEVRNRQALLAQRRSELELSRQQLAESVLLAPFDGAVRERHASLGQFVSAGQQVVTLVRMHPLRLRVAVPERESTTVRVGQEVRVSIEGDRTVYAGRVVRLSPALEETNRTLMVEAEVPNPVGALRPGSFARAEIVTTSDLPAIFVPVDAVVAFAGLDRVYVVRDDKAVEKRVRTGRRLPGNGTNGAGELVEITEGIAVGDTVVVNPGNLVDGQKVQVVK